jgi:hypothetical protein
MDRGVEDACGGLRDDESPTFTLESTIFSDEGSVVVFPKVDVLFGTWVVDGAGWVGPVVATEEFAFVDVLAVTCLFAALDGGGWLKEASGRRRLSGCDSSAGCLNMISNERMKSK